MNFIRTLRKQGLLGLLLLCCTGLLAQPDVSGTETIVNTTTASAQTRPAVAQDASGNYIVVWESLDQDGSDYGIYYQLFDATGTATSVETKVNNTTDYGQRFPAVAMNDAGNFVIVWMSDQQDGSGWGVYGQLYGPTGTALNGQLRVNSTSTGNQKQPDVAMDATGNIVVVYEDDNGDGDGFGIYMRRYNSSMVAQASRELVNDVAAGDQLYPAIDMRASGNYVITWQSQGTDGDQNGIYAKRFNSSGTALANQFLVNTTTAGNQQEPDIFVNDAGEFTIVWSSFAQDGDGYGIYAQRYTAAGATSGSEFLVNTTTSNGQDHAAIAGTGNGNFVVSWTSRGQDGSFDGVYIQAYDASASTLGTELLVNDRTTDFQQLSAIAWREDNLNLIAAWQSGLRLVTSTQDGDDYGIYQKVIPMTVTVDNPPVAVCQDITLYLDASGNGIITAGDVDGGSTDDNGITSYSINTSSFNCTNLGANTVTLTVGDVSGNTATCNANVTVVDTSSPTAVCQNLNVYLNSAGTATILAGDLDNGSSDNCSISGTSINTSNFLCTDIGANTVSLTVTDGSGNSSSCTGTVTVIDSMSPTAVCQDLNVYLAGGAVSITAGDLDNGSNDNCSISNFTTSTTSFLCADIGVNTVTLTVTDGNGNTGTCTSNVTVIDSTSPTAACQDVTLQLDAAGAATLTAAAVDAGSSDDCGTVSSSVSTTSFSCANIGSNVVTLTATDGSGNTGTCTANVTVEDNIAPTAVCQNATVYLNTSGSASITELDIENGSSDNCSLSGIAVNTTSFNCANIGANTVTLTVTDGSGNATTCTGTVTVIDSTNPTAVCQDVTLQLDAAGGASLTASAIDGGSSDNCGSTTPSITTTSFACADVGANTVTLTVADGNGNSSTCTANVTVEDNVSPIAICQDVTVQLDGLGTGTLTTNDVDNGSSDACGISSLSLSQSSFTCSDIGSTLVFLTVTDANGNALSCGSVVTIEDNVAPTTVCQDVTVQLDGTGSGSLATTDVNNGSIDACGIASLTLSNTSFACADVGANTVTLTATDVNGNTSTCTANITVEDNIAPTSVCQDVTVQLDGTGAASIATTDINNGSSDACGIASLSLDITNFTCTNAGANTVTLTSTDVNGNASTCTSTVTVQDNIAPTAICQDFTVLLGGTGVGTMASNALDNGSSDNCGIASYAVSQSNFTCADVGTVAVTMTVTDLSGNTATCTGNVTVEDVIAPQITCQNITIQLDATGNATIIPADIDNGSSDACGIASYSLDKSSFTCSDVGVNLVGLTITDVNGNGVTCPSNVTVEDNIAPTAVCQDVTVQLDGTGSGSITTTDIDNGSSDACGIASLSLDNTTFACTNVGANTVTMTVTDVNGNTSTCTSTATVQDNIAPTAICQDVTIQLDANGSATLATTSVDNGSSDACGTASRTLSNTSFACSNVGGNTVTLTVTDVNGNSSGCTANITVEDNVAPVAVCQDVTVQLDATGSGSISTTDVNNGSSDNCGIANLAISSSSYGCNLVGVNTTTLTVTDVNGNSSSCTANVTVQDNVAPNAICQDVTVQLDGTGTASITATDLDNNSIDACGIASLSVNTSSFTCANVGGNTVTLTATDVNGNSSTCTGNVTVQDNVAPSAVCQDVTVQLDANGSASITTADVDGGSTDACGIASLTLNNTSFNCSNFGGNTVTLTATDVNGNSSSCTANVIIQDNVAPVAVCQDVTVQLDGNGSGSLTTADVDNGSSDNCGVANLAISNSSFGCSNVGANTTTLTVTDVNGLTSTCVANVTVEDNVAPVAICQVVTVQLDVNGSASITSADLDGGITDNCGIANLSLSNSSFTCSDIGGNSVTLTATDVNGNISTCTGTVTVQDNIAPTVTCLDVTVQLDANGSASIMTSDIDGGSNDACGIANLALSNTSFTCSNVGGNTVTLTATDVNGNSSSCTANITVEDNIAPSAVCQDVTVQLDANGSGSITASGIDGGSSDNCGVSSLSLNTTSFNCANVGSNSVTLTVTDVNANNSTCTANVTVEDNIAPNAVCQDVTVQLDGTGSASITASDVNNGSNDNCGISSLSVNTTSFACSNVGGNTVTLTATDVNGNSSNCTANVTVQDNTAPIAICQDVTVQLDANGSGSIATTDVDGGSNDACGIANLALSNTSFTCSNVGGNTVTLTATDVNGNSSSCTANITVEDNIAPSAVCQDVTVQLDANGSASITANDVDGGNSDNCGVASLSIDNSNFACSNVGANTTTLTVTDVNGNSSTCTANVTVEDNIAPNAVCQDVTVQLNSSGVASLTTTDVNNGSNDACGIASLSLNTTTFGCANVGGNTVTLTATDVNGNSSTCTANITVEDNVAPVAICQDVTVQLDANGSASLSASDVDGGSNDNCGIASLAINNSSFTCSNVGVNTTTLTVTDVNGNSSTCTANVTVEDNIAPTAICQDVTVQLDANGSGSLTATDVNNGSSDNCGISSLSIDNSSFNCSNVGANTTTLTVTDVNGNTSSCTANVTLDDNVAPTAVCQDVTVLLDANGSASITASDVDNGSSDNCGVASISVNTTSFTCANAGGNTVTLTVTDVNGNTSTCTANVTVQDNVAPVAVCQDVTVQLDANGSASVAGSDIDGGSSDNCGIASLTASPATFTCQEIGTNVSTLTVTDASGNATTCTANVTVEDNIAPSAVCQNITAYLDVNGLVFVTATDLDGGSTDNCGVASLSTSAFVYGCGNVGTNSEVLTVTDGSGNSAACNVVITIEDTLDPVVACQDITISLDGNGEASISPFDVINNVFDNCGSITCYCDSLTQRNFDCNDLGVTTVVVIAHDVNGNSSSCTADVTVEDNIAPVAVCQDLTVQLDANGTASISAQDVDAGSSDNCSFGLAVVPSSFGCADLGVNAVVLTATDGSGNIGTCTANVTVEDVIAPSAMCQNVTIQLDANGNANVTPQDVDAGSSDNCSVASITLDATSFDCSQVGTNNVTLTVVDQSGNTSTCAATVNVEDNIAPAVACQDVTVQLDGNGAASITPGDIGNGLGDNCGIASIALDQTNFDCSQVGANSVTLTVTDVNGNASTCTANVEVEDNILPTAICQDVTAQLDANGVATITATDLNAGSNDNCGIATLFTHNTSFSCTNVGNNIVTLSVTDVNGNVSFCSANVTVEDNIAPTASCQDLTLQMDPSGFYTVDASQIDNGSSDNCSFGLSTANNVFSCGDVLAGTRSLTLTVTDASGNTSTCQAAVTLEDTTYSICCPYTFDFEIAGNGTAVAPGTIVTNQWAQYGIEVSAIGNDGPDAAVIFDSSNPPSNNLDLGTPNQAFGGPGVGNGGSSNSTAENNILVIARNLTDNNNDGLVDTPRDDNDGGQVSFDFTDRAMTIEFVNLIDVQQGIWNIILEKSNGSSVTIPVSQSGNNSAQSVAVFESDVRRMVIDIPRNGAIAGFTFCPDGNEYSVCETPLDFDRNDNGGFYPAGTIVNNQWELSRNVIISAENNNNSHPDEAITFYSQLPTGNDDDLGTPNSLYGGYGIGNGGSTNDMAEFNILVIAQNVNDTDNDGLVDDPSDENQGGTIRFDFTNYATVDSITIIDNQRNNSVLIAELQGGGTQTISIPNTGNNGVVTVPINLSNVEALSVELQRTGGVVDLFFCADGAPVTGQVASGSGGGTGAGAGFGTEMGQDDFTAYPNPFTEKSTITFSLNQDDDVTLKVYDLRGVEVATLFDGKVVEGELIDAEFAPDQISRGVYIARLTTSSGKVFVRKLVYE